MKFVALGLLTACAAFGNPFQIGFTGGTKDVAFNGGVMTFESTLSGSFPALTTNLTWSLTGTTFDYDVNGNITSGNPVTFTLSGDGGNDLLTGTVNLSSVANGPEDSAQIFGTLDITGVTVGSSGLDQALYALLNTDAGETITTGSAFNLIVNVASCNIDSEPSTCIITADPVGVATGGSLTPVPEPASAGLLCCGLAAAALLGRRFVKA